MSCHFVKIRQIRPPVAVVKCINLLEYCFVFLKVVPAKIVQHFDLNIYRLISVNYNGNRQPLHAIYEKKYPKFG